MKPDTDPTGNAESRVREDDAMTSEKPASDAGDNSAATANNVGLTTLTDPDMTAQEKAAFLADLYDEWVQVGWMPDDTLQDTYGTGPLDDGYLFTIEQAERDGGIKPDLLPHMIPVYARRHPSRPSVPVDDGSAVGQ